MRRQNIAIRRNRHTTSGLSALVCTAYLLLFLVLVNVVCAAETQNHNYKPEAGYVPDQETAIRIAVAVWRPIYGEELIESEKPYKTILKNGIWYASGSLPEGRVGGVAEAEISKQTGCVIRVSHGQ